MKKYILTSPKFQGSVTFGYDDHDNLVFYFNESDNLPAVQWLKMHLPVNEVELQNLKTKIEGTIKEVPSDLSFDFFWDSYDKKINRKRSEGIWKKLTDAVKMKAIMNIKPYDAYLQRTGIAKAHADNYISREYYLVDWPKER